MSSDRLTGNLATGDTIVSGVPFIGDVSTLDAITAYGLPLILMLVGQNIVPESQSNLLLGFIVFLAFIGTIGLIVAPSHTSLGTYASRFWHHQRRPAQVRYRRKGDQEDALERSFIEYDERAQDLTEVERIYPQYDVIELTDGTMVGAVEIRAGNLDTVDREVQSSVINATKDFFDNSLDFPIMFYLTTGSFDADRVMEKYEKRADDDDALSNPVLQYYINHHVRWVKQTMAGRPKREYYIIVPVEQDEVYEDAGGEDTVSSSLSEVPVLGAIVGRGGDQEDEFKLSEEEIKAKQMRMIDERINVIEANFVNAIGEEAGSERVTSAKFATLLKEYWEGEQIDEDEFKEMVGFLPIVIGERDKAEIKKKMR